MKVTSFWQSGGMARDITQVMSVERNRTDCATAVTFPYPTRGGTVSDVAVGREEVSTAFGKKVFSPAFHLKGCGPS